MAAQVYTFHITYEGLEDRIWRKVEVSSNYLLNRLGFMVLAAFDTMAYHLFEFRYDGKRFAIPMEDCPYAYYDMADFKLHQLKLKVGDRLQMDYDFGTTQTFWLELVGIEDMQRGKGTHYPYIIDGAGRGIIDDMHYTELVELIEQIDRNGQTDEPICYFERKGPWDYRWFNLTTMNGLLKFYIDRIEEGYYPFWEQYYGW